MTTPQSGAIIKIAELFPDGPPSEGERIVFVTTDGEHWYQVEGETVVGDWLDIGEERDGRMWYPLSSTLRWLRQRGRVEITDEPTSDEENEDAWQ